ncbi:polysaccharide pyruvyl transferase family protein [uncultured Alistipes sp.]|uniref:polysaccharide pyruvyl transferase family protein n=1 Tax=uncultured Alistipes sp. TaxID=538949 RepID=UPI002602CE3A|nr:polysaccharide pyruvyl transferase family protein [uncultured Alistipes sp.]
MKFGIITHYDVHNHGAILQLNALKEFLSGKGIEAQALQFDKNYDFMGVELKAKYNISLKSIGIYTRYLWNEGPAKTLFNYRKRNILNEFKRTHRLIGPYYSKAGQMDATVIGSDEVFALHTGPTPCLFGHACPGRNVFAYAGSFGPTTFEEIEKRNCIPFVKSGLENMTGISVRDQNSFSIVSRLLRQDPVLVCDPVLLYGYEKERASFKNKKIDLPPYLLVYAYDNRMNDKEEIAAIRKYANDNGLKIVSVGFYHAWCDQNINIDPIELLNYFACASAIVTDTFHGVIMSILNHGNFAVILRDNKNKLFHLLSEYKLTDRIVPDLSGLTSILSKGIDYNQVDGILQERRSVSASYLDSMIQLCR